MTGIVAGAALARAAARIERDGWHQGSYFPGHDASGGWRDVHEELNLDPRPCCALGAVMAEARTPQDYHDAEIALSVAYSGEEGDIIDVAYFNDGMSTTKEDVIALLRAAAHQCGYRGES